MSVEVNFVVFDWNRWGAALSVSAPALREVASRIISNEDIWSVQTYLHLAARGHAVTVSGRPRRGCINIVDGLSLWPRSFEPDLFCVGCRGDGHYPAFCQVVIHQNSLAPPDPPSIYIPQWPQPAIIPRDTARRGIKTIGFFGHAGINLAPEFKDEAFRAELSRRRYLLVISGKSKGTVRWNDYSEIDVVLSVRRIPPAHLMLKPPSKLVNAWIAGVPALIGPEPAVEAIAADGLDYVLVREPVQVIQTLEALRDDPARYQGIVDRGHRQAIN